jgi:hypothetical protein
MFKEKLLQGADGISAIFTMQTIPLLKRLDFACRQGFV